MIVLALLGSFRLRVDQVDRTSLLSYDKVKLLAAVLGLAHGKPLQRDWLAQMLWPDVPRDKALSRLRHALHVLRRALGPQASEALLAHEGGIVLLADRLDVDVLDFLHAPSQREPDELPALEPYGAAFLEGIRSSEAESFMAWKQSWLDRIALELLRVRARTLDCALESGQTDQALAAAKQWVLASPEQEAYHRLLISTLLRRGERQAALQAYVQCEQALRLHLGVEPDPQTRRLVDAGWPVASPVAPAASVERFRTVVTLALALSWRPGPDAADGLDGDCVPDEAVAYLDSWQEQLIDMVRQHGAWLSQASGSTLLAHFGFPQAQSVPLVRALDLACAIRALRTPERIGIGQALHVSLAVVDEQQVNAHSLFGQVVVPLAWKAEHGEVLLSPQALARLSDWQIESRRGPQGVFFALGAGRWQNDPLYGLQPQFDRLVQEWAACRTGQAKRAFHVHGQMGLGKSHLAQALQRYVTRDAGQPLILDFAHQDALDAVTDFTGLVARAGQADAAMEAVFRRSMHAWFGLDLAQQDQLLEGLAAPAVADDPPELRTCRLLAQVARLLAEQRRPLLLVLDHVEALGDARQAVLTQIWTELHDHPAGVLLVLLTRRADSGVEFAGQIGLTALSDAEANKALAFYARGRRLPVEARERLRALGLCNPMLIKDAAHLLRFGLPPEYLPRVADRLLNDLGSVCPDSRRVLFVAVLWEQATLTGLALACELSEDRTQAVVADLQAGAWLWQERDGTVVCAPVMRQALRRLIGTQESKVLYGRVAQSLIQARHAEQDIAACLALAHSEQAALWWRRAIDAALQAGQTAQAAEHLAQALSSSHYLKDVQWRRRYERDSYVTLGVLGISQGGPAAAPVAQAYQQASSRAGQPEDDLPVLWGRWILAHGAGMLPESLACAKQLQELARRLGHSAWFGWGLYAQAQYWFWKGRPQQSEAVLQEALTALSHMPPPPSMSSALGHHCPALVHSLLGLAQALQGRFDDGLQHACLAARLAAQSQSRISAVIAEIQMLRILYLQGELTPLAQRSQALFNALQSQLPGSVWSAVAQTYILYCRLVRGEEVGQDLDNLAALLPEFADNMPLALDAFLCILARCYLVQGDSQRARQALDQVCDIAAQRASSLYLPEVHCLQGDLAWIVSDRPAAQAAWALAQQAVLRLGLYAYESWIRHRRERLPDIAARTVWIQRLPS